MSEKTGNEVLAEIAKKAQTYIVTARMKIYAAGQALNNQTRLIAKVRLGNEGDSVDTVTQGTPTRKKVSSTRVRSTKSSDMKSITVYAFDRVDKNPVVTGFGGHYGIMHRAFKRAVKDMGHKGYKDSAFGLWEFTLEDGSIDLPIRKKVQEETQLQTINGMFGSRKMIPVFREYVEGLEAKIRITIPPQAPIEKQEFLELLDGVSRDGFGPTQHGNLEVMDVSP